MVVEILQGARGGGEPHEAAAEVGVRGRSAAEVGLLQELRAAEVVGSPRVARGGAPDGWLPSVKYERFGSREGGGSGGCR